MLHNESERSILSGDEMQRNIDENLEHAISQLPACEARIPQVPLTFGAYEGALTNPKSRADINRKQDIRYFADADVPTIYALTLNLLLLNSNIHFPHGGDKHAEQFEKHLVICAHVAAILLRINNALLDHGRFEYVRGESLEPGTDKRVRKMIETYLGMEGTVRRGDAYQKLGISARAVNDNDILALGWPFQIMAAERKKTVRMDFRALSIGVVRTRLRYINDLNYFLVNYSQDFREKIRVNMPSLAHLSECQTDIGRKCVETVLIAFICV